MTSIYELMELKTETVEDFLGKLKQKKSLMDQCKTQGVEIKPEDLVDDLPSWFFIVLKIFDKFLIWTESNTIYCKICLFFMQIIGNKSKKKKFFVNMTDSLIFSIESRLQEL